MLQVTDQQVIAGFPRLLEQVVSGEEVIILQSGIPVARLVPMITSVPRQPGIAKGRVTDVFFDPLPSDELAAWGQ